MFRLYISFIKQWLFWLLFFALGRSIFILYYSVDIWTQSQSIAEILMSFQKGFNLDIATSSYLMFFPFIIHSIQCFYSPMWLNKLNQFYHWILIALYALLIGSELGIYAEWKTKINYKALLYLQNPGEVVNSAQTSTMIGLFVLSIAICIFGIWIYNKIFHTSIIRLHTPIWLSLLFITISPALLVIGARGGIQEIPINQSQSYYSKNAILNSAATNSVFNLYISFHENQKSLNSNPFEEMPSNIANKIVQNIYHTPADSSLSILTTTQPNIVLIIMESWSSELIFTPEDQQIVTPNFRKLMKNGVYFDNIYATGPRSEQGMASVFSGFPAHPITSITVQPDKYNNLPSIIKDFNERGYYTTFNFGGQLIYGNIKSFIIYNQFDRIKEVYDFDENIPQGKLGIHDEFTLHEMLQDINKDQKPFFSALFTISTHSPYDQPMEEKIDWGGNVKKYLNGGNYTDYSIGLFMEEAAKQDWYNNTLFIFVADHSHNSYSLLPMQNIEYQKIPLLFYGNVIDSTFKGKTIHHLGVQTDIAATLLSQLNMETQKYPWSKDLLNPYAPQFAYSAYEEGFSWKRPIGSVSYEKRFEYLHNSTVAEQYKDSLIIEGKAYLQVLFQEYIDQ